MAGTLDDTVDIHCVDDFLPHMPEVRGRLALVHRLARRLTTERGRFKFWPNYGTDIRKFLLAKVQPERVAQEVEDECIKDEQVESVEVLVVEPDLATRTMTITISVRDAAGPFVFTLTISEAKATLISLQAAA